MRARRLEAVPAPDPRQLASRARHRVLDSFWAAAQASLAAAFAWWIAHTVLGHPQPFFAPIAAGIAMSTSYFGRSRRALQMVGGVLLGIATAELLVAALGTSTVALGATVLLTMVVALLVGGGFVGEGMMFVNQAAASAILVVTLHRHGTGAERAVDALVGCGSALLVGVLLFPAAPLPRLWAAERALLERLATTLERVADLLPTGEPPDSAWLLATGYEIHDRLAALAQARARAKANVRIAPRRWPMRAEVAAEDRRIARLDLLANAVLSLMRATTAGLQAGEALPDWLKEQIGALAIALRRLADTAQPWPSALLNDVTAIARSIAEEGPSFHVDRVPTVSAILGATARDLLSVTRGDERSPPARPDVTAARPGAPVSREQL
ncbi:MAG: FUSC family protein [Solirubrobacterales bacterium]|nr:FUSC family protein [Solirubrobacterales bacterium]